MRYIKTYEKNYSNLRKFIVTVNYDKYRNINIYIIFKILEITELNNLNVKRVYWCERNKIEEQDAIFFNEKIKLKDVLFTSDQIEECLNFVELMFSSNKYNL